MNNFPCLLLMQDFFRLYLIEIIIKMVRPFRLDEIDEVDVSEPLLDNAIIVTNNVEAMVPLPSIDAVLPDDCLHTIFEFLPLKDLQAFGRTCRRNNDSVNEYLYREYKTNTLDVKMIQGGVMFGSNRERLESHAAILKMHSNNINAWTIIAGRFKNVKKIIFNKTSVSKTIITPEHGIVLGDILRETESVEFKRNAFTDEHGQHTLKHCQKLKHLVIGTQIFKRTGELSHVWMEKMYSTLEDVQFDFGFPDLVNYDGQGEKIRKFFINNPSIKHLTILTNIEDSLNFIKSHNCIRFEKLTLILKTNVENVIDLLSHLQISGQIKNYGLIFQDKEILATHSQLINELNGLESVYMKKCNYDWANPLPAFFNKLKVLYIGDISPEGAKLLALNVVHLEEIYIERGSMEIIDTFVNRAADLRKIACNEVTGSPDDFNWISLIKGRVLLNKPRQLNIHVPEATYVPIKWKEMPLTLNLTETIPLLYLGLIKIKRVESLMPYRPY